MSGKHSSVTEPREYEKNTRYMIVFLLFIYRTDYDSRIYIYILYIYEMQSILHRLLLQLKSVSVQMLT